MTSIQFTYIKTFLIKFGSLSEISCDENALGAAEGGKLSGGDFVASSSYLPDFVPSNGRLNGPLAWCSREHSAGEEYLQIHVPEAESICAIATQGTGYSGGNEYVTEYHVKYSEDGSLWKEIEEEPGKMKVFCLRYFVLVMVVEMIMMTIIIMMPYRNN